MGRRSMGKKKNKKKFKKNSDLVITAEEQLESRRNLVTLEMILKTKPKTFKSKKKDYKRSKKINEDE